MPDRGPIYYSIPGTIGKLIINGFELPATSWNWDNRQTSVALSTASSMPFVDMRKGTRMLTLRASGVARKTFNPFNLGGAENLYLGSYCNITVIANNVGLPVTKSNCPSCLIVSWNYLDETDGLTTWQLEAVGNWTYQNMGGINNN